MLEKILSLNPKQKIGQLFFIGLPGPEFDEQTAQIIEEISPGGICLFTRNCREPLQIRRLLENVRQSLPIEPLLSLDQEGGLVDRLRRLVEPMPAPQKLKTPEDAARLAELTAQVISLLGFNMNFAPVVDVITIERGQFQNGIFSRTFGTSKEDVFDFSRAYLSTLQQNGIIGTIKHFPGLGATEVDSHAELPTVKIDFKEFSEVDLYPYFELLKTELVHAVMIAHAAFPFLDLQERDQNGKLLPSSLSFNFITKLLREQLGFNGLAVTDDMEMGAIVKNYGIGEACKMALKAGQDMLAVCNSPESIQQGFEAVWHAFQTGEISEDRINTSLQRIAAVKNLIKPPQTFDIERLQKLSGEISDLKTRL